MSRWANIQPLKPGPTLKPLFPFLACLVAALPVGVAAQRASLGIQVGEKQTEFRIGSLSEATSISPLDLASLTWQGSDGLTWAELDLAAGGLNIPVRAVIVRVDPKRFRFELQTATRANRVTGAWTVDSAGSAAALAVNAGQFKEAGPWGWLVMDGVERGMPGRGALAVGIAFDTAGVVSWLDGARLESAHRNHGITEGFQSYPLMLRDGRVPALALDARGVDHGHRDARLILAETDSGELLFVLTRLDIFGRTAERVPIGLTFPESVILARALGARHAVMLDGGISAQMLVRDNKGASGRWPGVRAVPVGLVAVRK